MAALQTALWCSLLFSGACAQDCGGSSVSTSAMTRLRNALFCDYDREATPVRNQSNAIIVDIELVLDHLNLNEALYSLELHCWTTWQWNDELLTWNASDYEGINGMVVDETTVWTPNIWLSSASAVVHPSAWCHLTARGRVYCTSPTLYETHCVPDLTRWPYDTHSCVLTLSSWLSGGELNLLNFDSTVWNAIAANIPALEWKILNVSYDLNVTEEYGFVFQHNRYSYLVQRHSGSYAATVVVPAVVLSSLTLLTFWLDPRGAERIVIGSVNVMAHCLYLQYLGFKLRSSAEKCPLIVQFFRDSLVLTGVALLLTLLARGLAENSRGPSQSPGAARGWTPISWMLRLLQLPPKGDCWLLFSVLLDRLSFLGFSVALAWLLLRLAL